MDPPKNPQWDCGTVSAPTGLRFCKAPQEENGFCSQHRAGKRTWSSGDSAQNVQTGLGCRNSRVLTAHPACKPAPPPGIFWVYSKIQASAREGGRTHRGSLSLPRRIAAARVRFQGLPSPGPWPSPPTPAYGAGPPPRSPCPVCAVRPHRMLFGRWSRPVAPPRSPGLVWHRLSGATY